MAEKRDYYEVLGVAKDADDAAIKKAYREIAKKYHPDINPSAEAAEIFKEASEAYSVLSDKEKRAQYDQFGHAAFDGSGGGYGGGFSGFSGDMGDIFGDIFGDLFGGGRSRRNDGPMKGANLRTAVLVRNVRDVVRLQSHSSQCLVWFVTFRSARIVMEVVRS